MNRETIFQALSGEDPNIEMFPSLVSNRWRGEGGLTHLSNFCFKVNLRLLVVFIWIRWGRGFVSGYGV